MEAAPHGAEAIERRHARRGGKVGIGAAAGLQPVEGDPLLFRRRSYQRHQRLGVTARAHRRLEALTIHLDPATGEEGVVGHEGEPLVHGGRFVIAPEAQVNDRLGKVGHHVDAGPSLHHPHVHGGAGVEVDLLVDGEHPMGQLGNGGDPLAQRRAGVGGLAVEGNAVLGIALAGADEIPVRAGRLGHQHAAALSGLLHQPLLGPGGAYLLVAIAADQHLELGQHGRVHLFEGIPGGEQAALHVRHAGAKGLIAFDFQWALGRRPLGEDGIHVAHQHHVVVAGAGGIGCLEAGAALGGELVAGHLPADGLIFLGHDVGHRCHPGRGAGTAIEVDEGGQIRQVGV